MGDQDVELVRGAWAAFAADGACEDRAEALAFIQRALGDGVTAELLELREVDDHIVSIIQTYVRPNGASSHRLTARSSRCATARSSKWSSTQQSTTR